MKKFIVCLIVAITLSNCEIKVKTSNAQISRVTEEEWIKTSESTGVFVKRLNIDEGYYKKDEGYEYFSFRAGSYSGYNQFRELLCESILYVKPEKVWENCESYIGKPFYELINFSDCEGTMGPIVSKKLHEDFIKHRDKFETYLKNIEDGVFVNYYMNVNNSFTKAFEMTSEGGVLIFA